jgi:hypothetical protein
VNLAAAGGRPARSSGTKSNALVMAYARTAMG